MPSGPRGGRSTSWWPTRIAPPPEKTEELLRELAERRIDAVVFTSSSTVVNLCDLLGPSAYARLAGVRIASIGPLTTETVPGKGASAWT